MILVTGATGFLGSYIVKDLVKNKYKVRGIARDKEKAKVLKNVDIVYGDLLNKNDVFKALKGCKIIIHAAAVIFGKGSDFDANVKSTKNLIEACKKLKINKFIFISSVAATTKNLGDYGRSKLECEKLLLNSGLNLTIFQPTLIYGKESTPFNKIINFVENSPLFIPIIGNGNNKFRPVYVEDVAKLVTKAVKSDKKGSYLVGGKNYITFNELIDSILINRKLRKIKLHIPYSLCRLMVFILGNFSNKLPINSRSIMVFKGDSIMDISKAEKDFNYRPITFQEGIKLTFS